MALYKDTAICQKGHKIVIYRRESSAGKVVDTYCPVCRKSYKILAGSAVVPPHE